MHIEAPRATVWLLTFCMVACDRRADRVRAQAMTQISDECQCDPSRLAARPVVWGEAHAGLRFGLAVDGTCVELRLENVGASPLSVFSHVYGGTRPDLEGYTLHLIDARGTSTAVDLGGGPRRESGPVYVSLTPGQSERHEVNVAAGGCYPGMRTPAALRGEYQVIATYAPRCEPGRWCGRLTAGLVTLRVP